MSVRIFVSYAREDAAYAELLEQHLSALQHTGAIYMFDDRKIQGGAKWDNQIKRKLEEAHLIIFLISPALLASTYIFDVEVPTAIKRHQAGTVDVIPIALKSCQWRGTPFEAIQALPRNQKPIDQWEDVNIAFTEIVTDLYDIVEKYKNKKDDTRNRPNDIVGCDLKQYHFFIDDSDCIMPECAFLRFVSPPTQDSKPMEFPLFAEIRFGDQRLHYDRFSFDVAIVGEARIRLNLVGCHIINGTRFGQTHEENKDKISDNKRNLFPVGNSTWKIEEKSKTTKLLFDYLPHRDHLCRIYTKEENFEIDGSIIIRRDLIAISSIRYTNIFSRMMSMNKEKILKILIKRLISRSIGDELIFGGSTLRGKIVDER